MRRVVGFFLALAHVSALVSCKILRPWHDIDEKHSWVEVPEGWEHLRPAPKNHTFDLRIGLKSHRMDELISTVLEISDPSHPKYGQHLTPEEVHALAAPHPSSCSMLSEWLDFHSIPSSAIVDKTPSGDFITLRTTVAQAEHLLNTHYAIYHHPASGQQVIRTMSYSLPKILHEHITVVTPTTYFSTLKTLRKTSFVQPEIIPLTTDIIGSAFDAAVGALTNGDSHEPGAIPASCNRTITPSCLRKLYKTENYVPKSMATNKLGVAGYLEQYANRADLQTFFSRFRPDARGSSYDTVLVNEGKDDQSLPGVEANLDIQYTTGLSYPTPNIYYSTGGRPPFKPDEFNSGETNEPFLEFLNYITVQPRGDIPQVISTSYGEHEQTVPKDYAEAVCWKFVHLAALGTSVIFASGDWGVGGGSCRTNDGRSQVLFQPIFPAACPFVTAVGGTTGINPETGAAISGGGFSRYFSQPVWQNAAVAQYLAAIGPKHRDMFTRSGRAFPDVSAQSSGFQVVVDGSTISVGGTSASAPVFAAIVALLNDQRLSEGKSPLGYLNPMLYAIGSSGFNDITSGSNPGCGTDGFQARPGWDPVTGLGTPDFEKLLVATRNVAVMPQI